MIKVYLESSHIQTLLIFCCLLILMMLETSKTEDIGVYGGEYCDEGGLAETCATGKYSYVNIDFLDTSDNGQSPELRMEGHLYPPSPSSSFLNLQRCSFLSSEITFCQQKGIKVMLSIGGYGSYYNLTSTENAKNLSDYLWNNFLGGKSSSRPLGETILDGVNFFIQSYSIYWENLASYLKSYTTKQSFSLSASVPCSFDSSDGNNFVLNNGPFDYLSVQFYDHPECEYSKGGESDRLIKSWNEWTKIKVGKLFLELSAGDGANITGYIPVNSLISQILPYVRGSSNYGGIMLWTREEDKVTGYSANITSPLCRQQDPPQCSSRNINFAESFGYMSMDSFMINESEVISRQCCEVICRNNCSCVAYAAINDANGIGCQIWSIKSIFISSSGSNGKKIYVAYKVEQKQTTWEGRKHRPARLLWLWIIIDVGVPIAIPFILYLSCVLHRKNRAEVDVKKKQDQLKREIRGNASDKIEIFSFESMVTATNNFSADNKLGKGGFGLVYMGRLTDGREIAIKRLIESSGQGLTEFKNEAKLIAKLQHTNLVRLLGFCIHIEERMLVYEYMPNRSLDFHLFAAERKDVLDWEKRLNIIEGIAQGLLYLHKYSRFKVIHRDLKTSNVLLDGEMKPKISDFGMARILGLNGSEEKTKRIVGTYGYMSPEAFKGIVSTKTDVFSFGVLMLEILSGKKNNCFYCSESPLNLIGYAWKLWNEGRTIELMDPRLNETACNSREVLRCIHIGLLCVQDHAIDRPTMFDVVTFLSNDAIQLPQPKQPGFYINVDMDKLGLQGNKQEKYSINYVTISVVEGR